MPKKSLAVLLIVFLLLTTNIFAQPELDKDDFDSYVLIDRQSGHVLLEKDKDKIVNIEGATNLATVIMAVEKADLNKKITIGENPVKVMGTKIYLQEKEKLLLSELVKAALVYSANDAALAISEHMSGEDYKFIEELNEKVKAIGCLNTAFTNSYGQKDSRHVTTAYDLALLGRYAMKLEKINEYAKIKSFNWNGASWQALLTNRNILLEDYPGINGLIAGTRTDPERLDLVFTYQKDDKDYILVMTNARAVKAFDYAAQLIEYASENFTVVRIVDEGEEIISITTQEGEILRGLSQKSISLHIKVGVKVDPTKEFFMDEIKRPLKAGDKIGEVLYYAGGEELERIDIIADRNLPFKIEKYNLAIYAFAGLYLFQILFRVFKMNKRPKRR